MFNHSIRHFAGKWLAMAALLLGFGLAMAQSEPTLNQVYEAAQSGRLEQAQTMMQQVLVAHPNSARAHFVQSELSARQGRLSQARDSFATAEKLAPGLPFAKPEAVQALRSQLAGKTSAGAPATRDLANRTPAAAAPAAPAPSALSSFPWGLGLLLVGGVIAISMFLRRRKATAPAGAPGTYANQAPMQAPGSGLNGPQTFGTGGAPMQPPYGQPGYGQPGYGQQPAGNGLGGRLAGGLATGLAVGAGVMAAQAIGKTLSGNNEHAAHQPDSSAGGNAYQPLPGNNDLGGQNFGVNDAGGGWDDGGSVASSDGGGGGGDWDT